MTELKVILDTNFMMLPGQFGIDIFKELDRIIDQKYQLCTLTPIVHELERLSREAKGKDKTAAKLALGMMPRIEKIEVKRKADEAIVETAKQEKAIVATNDAELRRKLKKEGITAIYLRQKSHLAANGRV